MKKCQFRDFVLGWSLPEKPARKWWARKGQPAWSPSRQSHPLYRGSLSRHSGSAFRRKATAGKVWSFSVPHLPCKPNATVKAVEGTPWRLLRVLGNCTQLLECRALQTLRSRSRQPARGYAPPSQALWQVYEPEATGRSHSAPAAWGQPWTNRVFVLAL